MEDGRNSSSSISSTSGQQQQQDLVVTGEAFGPGGGTGGGGGWGTLEELLLIGSISRHGSGDWAVVAAELQGRARLLSMPPAYFSPEACKNKFDALSGRYGSLGYRSGSGGGGGGGGGAGRDKEPENHPVWFEDIRRRRVAQLKRELERHDGCIVSLSNKLKRLKAERAQGLQTANKQQQPQQVVAAAAGKAFPDDSSALEVAAESQKPLDSSKAEPQADVAVDEGIKPSASPSALDPPSTNETPSSEPPPATSEEEEPDVGLPPPALVEVAPQELVVDDTTAAAADASETPAEAPETNESVGVEPPPPEAEPVPAVVETDRSIEDDEIGVGIGEKAVESTEGEGITADAGTERVVIHPAEPVAPVESLAAVVPEEAKPVEVAGEERPSVDDDSAVVVVDPVCTSDKVAEVTESLDSKPAVESEQRDDAALNTEDAAAMEERADAKEGNPNSDVGSKDEELDKLDESPERPGGLDAQVETEEEKKSQEVYAKSEELHDEADAIKGVATEEENEEVNADVDMVCLKNEAADLRAEDDDKSDDFQTAAGKDEGSLLSKVELKSSEEAADMETDETAIVDTSRKDEDAMDVDEAPVVGESAEVGAAASAEAVESPEPSQAEGLDVEPVPVVVQANEVDQPADQPADEVVKNMETEDAVELHPEITNSGVVEPQKEAEAAVVDEAAAASGFEPANVAPSVPAAEVEAVQEKKTVDSDFVEPASEAAGAVAAAEAASELTEAAADGSHQLESAVVLSEVVDPPTVSTEERLLPEDAGEAQALDLSKDATSLPPAEEDAGAMATDSEAITAEKMAEDVGVKLVGEGGQLVVDIIGEPLDHPVEPSRPAEAAEEEANPGEEKEASSSAVQSSSSQGTTKQSAYKEKSDESQGGGARQADSVEKPETVVCKASRQDVGSPASANEDFQEEKDEGSGSAQEQSKDGSQVEKSEVGGSQVDGPEDTSPTSRRLKKEGKLPGKLQPLLECLRTICAHKFAPLFKQRQESQDDPRYDQVIRRHVDLNMIRARLEEGGYSGSLEFFRDLLLVFNNSIVFYPRDSQEYNASVALRKLTLEEMDRILQAEVLMKQDRPATRKRDSKRPVESVPVSVPVPATAPAATTTSRAGVTGSSLGKLRQGNVGGGLELSTSDNSKSKSASLSLGVPSSRGGEEEDAREGEPEVEGKSTAKPLKAYGRKNRGDAAQQEARRAAAGKGVARERPKESLEAIVKKIGKAEEAAAAALAKETAAAAAAKETSSKASAVKETLATAKAREAKEKAAAAVEASKASSKAPAGRQAAGEAPAPAPTTSTVRGARNKRPSAKEATQRSASAGKRTRRI